jgi:hypothetical protein
MSAAGVCLLGGRGLVGQFRSGHHAVAGREMIGLCRWFAAGVGGAQRDSGGREQEDRTGQQRLAEACGERVGRGDVGRQQGPGACGGDSGEDREAERGPELL